MTTFDHIIEDHCLGMIDDYKITHLYKNTHHQDGTIDPKWYEYLDGFLHIAIGRFASYCDHLEYTDRSFNNDLSGIEIEILTLYWIIAWGRREINNSSQLQQKLKVNSGFTMGSEAQNTKAKLEWIDGLEEEVARKITQYQLMNTNW